VFSPIYDLIKLCKRHFLTTNVFENKRFVTKNDGFAVRTMEKLIFTKYLTYKNS
jgi:hypothetical protein